MPVLDPSAVPHLDAAGRAQYLRFTHVNLPRAFAISSGSGKIGWYGGTGTLEEARTKALKSCADKGAADCALYAENLGIVWPARAWVAAAPPAALISTTNHAFVPDERFLWHGPQAAAGVYVWGHGKAAGNSTDLRGLQPQAHVRQLNNRGYDIVRFDRPPESDDAGRAKLWLRDGLRELRARGWRKVIVGGQSRGGWNALQMLQYPGIADAIVSVAAAMHGSSAGGIDIAHRQHDDLRGMLRGLAPQETRVVIVQFQEDPYIGNAERRLELFADYLRPAVPALLVIDRPPGIKGHGAGASFQFAERFGTCIARFITGTGQSQGC